MTKINAAKPAAKRTRRMAREPQGTEATDHLTNGDAVVPIKSKPPHQTKASQVEAMLAEGQGATLDALCEATGWQPHTCRAFLTGLRKKGKQVGRTKDNNGATIYCLTGLSEPSEKDAR